MSREITTHRVNGVNECIVIEAIDFPGHGGACHEYRISGLKGPLDHHPIPTIDVRFQNGPIQEVGTNVTQEALLAIVKDRLEHFQAGPYACEENGEALKCLNDALEWLHIRTKRRITRGVEGTHTV